MHSSFIHIRLFSVVKMQPNMNYRRCN